MIDVIGLKDAKSYSSVFVNFHLFLDRFILFISSFVEVKKE